MSGWTDIHSHILPCVDDGSVSLKQSRKMLEIAYKEGITSMFATPHYSVGCVNMEVEELKKNHASVSNIARDIDPSFEVLLGNELYYSEDIIRHLRQGKALTLNETRYVLVEFPSKESFDNIKTGVHRLLIYGYLPIISHVERYGSLMDNLGNIQTLIDLGVYTQINISTVLGDLGKSQRRFCKDLIEYEMLHFLGTNCHSDYRRAPYMKKGIVYLKRRYGDELIDRLLIDNPRILLKNEYIYSY